MVYLVIKELSALADDVIIVTSRYFLQVSYLFWQSDKGYDWTRSRISWSCNSRSVHDNGCRFSNTVFMFQATMVQSIERYLKQAIVDKNPAIASAVLTSAFKLMQHCPDVIKRWVNECQEAANSSRIMVQYHALGLLYVIRRKDRLAITKMIQKFTRSGLRSPYAFCIMVCCYSFSPFFFQLRIVAKQIDEEGLRLVFNISFFILLYIDLFILTLVLDSYHGLNASDNSPAGAVTCQYVYLTT